MLRVEGITVAINAVTILRGLSLTVESGAVVGLVGRNGAGKTTTIRSIMGLTHLSSGRIDLDGNKLNGMSSYLRARLGIGYLPEDRRLVGALSVRDNLLIPAEAGGIPNYDERLHRIFDLMPELKEWSARKASTPYFSTPPSTDLKMPPPSPLNTPFSQGPSRDSQSAA